MSDLKITIGASCKAALDEINKLGTDIKGMGGKLNKMLATIGAGLSIGGAIAFFDKLTTAMDNTAKAAARLGVDTGTYQAVVDNYEHAGASAQDFEKHIKKVTQTVRQAANGNATAAQKLGLIGVAWQEIKDKSPVAQLQAVAAALAAIEDPAKRTAMAVELFGDEGAKILNVANSLNSIDTSAMHIIDDEQLKAAEKLKDDIQDLKKAIIAKIVDSGIIYWLKEVMAEINAITGGLEKTRKNAGKVNRKEGVNEAIERARSSGKFTQAQLTDMAKFSPDYVNKSEKPLATNLKERFAAFMNIDKALKDSGYHSLARDEKLNFGGYEQDYADRNDAEVYRAFAADHQRKWGRDIPVPAMTMTDRRRYDPRIKAEQDKKKKEAEAQAKREKTIAETEAKAVAEISKKTDDAVEKQIKQLEQRAATGAVRNSGTGAKGGTNEKREAYIAEELNKARNAAEEQRKQAEKIAKGRGKTLSQKELNALNITPEREKKIRDAAGKAYDSNVEGGLQKKFSESASDLHSGVKDELSAMDRKLQVQLMINAGKRKEAAIQEAINAAEDKSRSAVRAAEREAKANGRTLTNEERKKYELSDEEKNAIREKAEKQFLAQNYKIPELQSREHISDSYSRIGAKIGGASASSVDTRKTGVQTVEKLTALDAKLQQVLGKMPTGTSDINLG